MTQQPEYIDVPVHLLVEPRWANDRYFIDSKGRPILQGGKVTKATQHRPHVGGTGGVVTKVTLRLPAAAFLPLQPEAVVVVKMEDLDTVLSAEASDPSHKEP